jgi:hypothetical protein
MLAPLAIFYLYRHRWWFPGYLTSLLTYILFVLLPSALVETIGLRQGCGCTTAACCRLG